MPAVLLLMLVVLGLSAGTVPAANARVDQEESRMPTFNAGIVGAFDEDGVAEELQLPASVVPLYLLPIGRH